MNGAFQTHLVELLLKYWSAFIEILRYFLFWICAFFSTPLAWCLTTGHAPGESCPFAWRTSVFCTGMSCQEPWQASLASGASSRTMLIYSAPWTRWNHHTDALTKVTPRSLMSEGPVNFDLKSNSSIHFQSSVCFQTVRESLYMWWSFTKPSVA